MRINLAVHVAGTEHAGTYQTLGAGAALMFLVKHTIVIGLLNGVWN